MLESQIYKYCLDRFNFFQTRGLYVFGAGEIGTFTVRSLLKLGLEVQGVIDNDPNKWSQKDIEGISVISLDQYLLSATQKPFILVALIKYEEVMNQLCEEGQSELIIDAVVKVIEDERYGLEHEMKRLFESLYYGIDAQISREALVESAKFVQENMFYVRRFSDRYALMKHIFQGPLIEGSFLEFGVFKGDSINFWSTFIPSKIAYGFDSFQGLPEDWFPGFEKGAFALKKLPQYNDNVQLVKGWYNETLPEFVKLNDHRCAFIHVDCDLYSSTKTIFNELKDRIVIGTVILFDEYLNYPGWQNGEYKAFMELVNDVKLEFEYIGLVSEGKWSSQVAVRITRVG